MVHSWKQGKLRGRGSIDEISNENAHSVKLTSRRLGLAGVVDSEEKVGIGEKGWIIITSPQDRSLCGVGEWEVTQLNSAPLGTLCPDLQPRQGCRPRGGLVLVCTRVCLCVQACTDAWGLGLSTCAEGAALLTAPSERAALFLLLPHGSSHCLTLDETFTCHQFLVSSH